MVMVWQDAGCVTGVHTDKGHSLIAGLTLRVPASLIVHLYAAKAQLKRHHHLYLHDCLLIVSMIVSMNTSMPLWKARSERNTSSIVQECGQGEREGGRGGGIG